MAGNNSVMSRNSAAPVHLRSPMPLVAYEEAVNSLRACCTVDEALYFSNQAEALSAWSKIFHSNEAYLTARRLKLHAYRRMNELAEQLRPARKGTSDPGPASLLREQGLEQTQVNQIRRVGQIPERRFKEMIEQARPPAITKAVCEGLRLRRYRSLQSTQYQSLMGRSDVGVNLLSFLAFTSRFPANESRLLEGDEVLRARDTIRKIQEWLDDLDRFLPTSRAQAEQE